jgi:hypothetical protein
MGGGCIYKEITILNLVPFNNRPSKRVKQTLIELKRNKVTVMGGDFSTLCSVSDRMRRQKLSRDIRDLASPTNQLNLIDI